MQFSVPYYYKQQYLPTSRHRKTRGRYVLNTVEVEIAEPTEQQFPVAFVVTDYGYIYEEENASPKFILHSTEIRVHNNMLWRAVRHSERVSHGVGWMPASMIVSELSCDRSYYKSDESFTEYSIDMGDNRAELEDVIQQKASQYIIFAGKVWRPCGEPMYNITTFGLGHNHGGTGIFVDYYYNSNLPAKNYFSALERERAIAYGKMVAMRRGDTDDIDRIDSTPKMIEVLMPQMVKRNSAKDHGDGDPFLNSLEEAIEKADSVMESGLCAIALCKNQITDGGYANE